MPRTRRAGSGRRLGKQPPRHRYFQNPYPDARFTVCPRCSGKTRQRKFPLVVHVDPQNLVMLNKVCRYCPACDLLIAHQDQIEAMLAALFTRQNPDAIGNDYLVLGTVERADWRRGTTTSLSIQDVLHQLHDFEQVLVFEPAPSWGPA
jgi:hypothetical protein